LNEFEKNWRNQHSDNVNSQNSQNVNNSNNRYSDNTYSQNTYAQKPFSGNSGHKPEPQYYPPPPPQEDYHSEPPPPPPSKKLLGINLDFLKNIQIDDLILIGIGILLLLDSDASNDMLVKLIAMMLFF